MQLLAIVKPLVIESYVWQDVIGQTEATNQAALKFYQAENAASKLSRTAFWEAVAASESQRAKVVGRDQETPAVTNRKKRYQKNSRR